MKASSSPSSAATKWAYSVRCSHQLAALRGAHPQPAAGHRQLGAGQRAGGIGALARHAQRAAGCGATPARRRPSPLHQVQAGARPRPAGPRATAARAPARRPARSGDRAAAGRPSTAKAMSIIVAARPSFTRLTPAVASAPSASSASPHCCAVRGSIVEHGEAAALADARAQQAHAAGVVDRAAAIRSPARPRARAAWRWSSGVSCRAFETGIERDAGAGPSIPGTGDRRIPHPGSAAPPVPVYGGLINEGDGAMPRRAATIRPIRHDGCAAARHHEPGDKRHGQEDPRHADAGPARERPLAELRDRPEAAGPGQRLHGRPGGPAGDLVPHQEGLLEGRHRRACSATAAA